RETGGNLAEIIATISTLIRERFKLHGKIRVLSAEGRISAWILLALPFVITGILWLMNPDYVNVLFTEEMGRHMIWGSLGSMAVGFLVIKRMIKIKV
ncbi:MAG: type II secretion system F family protein, partial [Proteobacteria bacterium]|nr:type II secretion system F family protein [Pseudomonadota bacterium]